jgi:hypothetical protein
MKTTINLSLALAFALACASAASADTVIQTTVVTVARPAPVAVLVVLDGFTEHYEQVMITRNGRTSLMAHDMKLHNGVVIRPDGVIVVPGKMNRELHSGDWLGFDGMLTRADSSKVEYLRPAN